jgi:hypothetical protein
MSEINHFKNFNTTQDDMADDVDQLHVDRIHRSEYQLYSYREYPPALTG